MKLSTPALNDIMKGCLAMSPSTILELLAIGANPDQIITRERKRGAISTTVPTVAVKGFLHQLDDFYDDWVLNLIAESGKMQLAGVTLADADYAHPFMATLLIRNADIAEVPERMEIIFNALLRHGEDLSAITVREYNVLAATVLWHSDENKFRASKDIIHTAFSLIRKAIQIDKLSSLANEEFHTYALNKKSDLKLPLMAWMVIERQYGESADDLLVGLAQCGADIQYVLDGQPLIELIGRIDAVLQSKVLDAHNAYVAEASAIRMSSPGAKRPPTRMRL